jgi:hypothetical protein
MSRPYRYEIDDRSNPNAPFRIDTGANTHWINVTHPETIKLMTNLIDEANELRRYRNSTTWHTTCLSCPDLLDKNYAQYVQLEAIKLAVAKVRQAKTWGEVDDAVRLFDKAYEVSKVVAIAPTEDDLNRLSHMALDKPFEELCESARTVLRFLSRYTHRLWKDR